MKYSVLIVDDEKLQRNSLAGFLSKKGYQSFTGADVDEALSIVSEKTIEIVFTDFNDFVA